MPNLSHQDRPLRRSLLIVGLSLVVAQSCAKYTVAIRDGGGTGGASGGDGSVAASDGSTIDGGSDDVIGTAALTLEAAPGSSIDFGAVLVGSAADGTYVVTNRSQQSSSSIGLSLIGAGFGILPPAVSDCAGSGSILAGGASCMVRIRFTPSATTTFGAALAITATIGGTPPSLKLTGKGTCQLNSQCTTSFCSTGVCCNEACNDGCHICNLPESNGICVSRITEFPVPGGSAPHAMTVGPDSNLWFTDYVTGRLGKIVLPVTGASPVMTFAQNFGAGSAITSGPDGRLWFVDDEVLYRNGFGRVNTDLSNAFFRPIPVTTVDAFTTDIVKGSDNNLWVVDYYNGAILKVSTAGEILNTYPAGAYKATGGSDSAIWFTNPNSSAIGRIDTEGSLTEYPLASGTRPNFIVEGPDGAFWFTTLGNGIGRMTLSGVLTKFYPVPTTGASLAGLTSGPDGAVWFIESGDVSRIGRITVDGSSTTECPTPTPASNPITIVTGGDGNIWLTERNSAKVARFIP
jgi:virginiamycin B lyase